MRRRSDWQKFAVWTAAILAGAAIWAGVIAWAVSR